MMDDTSKPIFDLSNDKNIYKGVFFAEMDLTKNKNGTLILSLLPNFCPGIMGIIWVDEHGIWNAKMRVKYPSGSKQVLTRQYKEEYDNNFPINETYILSEIYKFPMKNKKWLKNESGKGEGIVELLQQEDMIKFVDHS